MSSITKLALLAVVATPVAFAQENPGFFKVPGTETQMKFSGEAVVMTGVELHGGARNILYKEGFPSPTNVALDNEKTSKNQVRMSAGDSSLGFESITPSRIGKIGTVLLLDAGDDQAKGGHGGPVRLKKAYGTIGEWFLLGLEGSLFDSPSMPDALLGSCKDNGGSRAPQVRFMGKYDQTKLAFSIEDTINIKGLDNAYNTYSAVARLDVPVSFADFNLRGVGINYKNADVSGMGWGAAAGAIFKIGKDKLTVNVAGGSGMGDYMGGMEGSGMGAVHDTVNNKLYFWKSVGASLGYTHNWNSEWRSTLWGSGVAVKGDNKLQEVMTDRINTLKKKKIEDEKDIVIVVLDKDGKKTNQTIKIKAAPSKIVIPTSYGECNRRLFSAGVNAIWTPAKNFSIGGELTYNFRKRFDNKQGNEMFFGVQANYKLF